MFLRSYVSLLSYSFHTFELFNFLLAHSLDNASRTSEVDSESSAGTHHITLHPFTSHYFSLLLLLSPYLPRSPLFEILAFVYISILLLFYFITMNHEIYYTHTFSRWSVGNVRAKLTLSLSLSLTLIVSLTLTLTHTHNYLQLRKILH